MSTAKSLQSGQPELDPAVRTILSMRDVSKVYGGPGGERVTALQSFSLAISENQFVSLIGPSGCGKSTALSIMAGLSRPDSGEVLINGHPTLRARQAHEIGMVFQQPVLLPWRTIEANCALLLEVAGLWNAEGRQRVADTLDMVGLREFARAYPHQLSGGMQQRASIARALCLDPVLLMMDEPFGALDEFTRHNMNVELLKIWSRRRKTIVFITHSVAEAVFLSDRVVAMSPRPGRIVADLAIDLDRPRDPQVRYTRAFNDYVAHMQRLLEPGTANAEYLA